MPFRCLHRTRRIAGCNTKFLRLTFGAEPYDFLEACFLQEARRQRELPAKHEDMGAHGPAPRNVDLSNLRMMSGSRVLRRETRGGEASQYQQSVAEAYGPG